MFAGPNGREDRDRVAPFFHQDGFTFFHPAEVFAQVGFQGPNSNVNHSVYNMTLM